MSVGLPLPPRDDPALTPFWDWAAKGELRLPRRLSDGGFDWYPSGAAVEWVRIGGRATLFSWAVVTRPLAAVYADLAPYVAALVEPVDAPGVRLVTRLVAVAEPLTVGMALTVRFDDLGAPALMTGIVAPLFTPA